MSIQPPRKILIPMDDSEHSFYTFDWFIKYFLKDRDHVFLFHCDHPGQKRPSGPPETVSASRTDARSESRSDSSPQVLPLESRLKNLVSDNGIKGQVILVESKHPGEAIAMAVDDYKIDVIVMGSQGEGLSAKTSVGRVCAYVMENTYVPTVVCRLPIKTTG